MLKYEFKDTTPERQKEMLSEIISKYNVANRNELIQALGHAQAILDCTQEQFANHPLVDLSSRQLRNYKKEYLNIYEASFAKYQEQPELKEVEFEVEATALDAVYENLVSRLQSPKTSTKDLSLILTYFNISASDLKQFTQLRNKTMRGFVSDNLTGLVQDTENENLIKALLAESKYLYQGTEKSVGHTYNSLNMDLDNPLVKLEIFSLGLLFIGLYNGRLSEAFVNHAQALRMLKLASGKALKEMQKSHKEFDRMDGKEPTLKAITSEMEKDLIEIYGKEQGKEMFRMLSNTKDRVAKKTVIKMPKYEDVEDAYNTHLKVYPEMDEMPIKVFVARLNAEHERDTKSMYQQFIESNKEDNN